MRKLIDRLGLVGTGFICVVIMIALSTLCIVDAINDLGDAIKNRPAAVINIDTQEN